MKIGNVQFFLKKINSFNAATTETSYYFTPVSVSLYVLPIMGVQLFHLTPPTV